MREWTVKAAGHLRAAARTWWTLVRRSPCPRSTGWLVARMWLRERCSLGDGELELLRLYDGGDVLDLWVGGFSDLHVARETFGEQVYALPGAIRPRTILDLGANIGASVIWFARRFPDAEIHAVEPDRRSLEKLRRNVAHLPRVTVHHAAVAGEDGERTFFESQRGWASSLIAEVAREARPATVEALTLPALVRERMGRERVDLLKIDIEGAEWEMLPTLRLAERAEVVTGELHPGLLGDPAAERAAWRHGLAGLHVRFDGPEGRGHFVALPHGQAVMASA